MAEKRAYLDTSVWNFYYSDDVPDEKEVTEIFFKNMEKKNISIHIAEPVLREISNAPENRKRKLFELLELYRPFQLDVTSEAERLADEYIRHGALPQSAETDALHIACASVHEMDYMISWNMRHIANVNRQEKIQAINLLNGYTKTIQLITPYAVAHHEDIDHT